MRRTAQAPDKNRAFPGAVFTEVQRKCIRHFRGSRGCRKACAQPPHSVPSRADCRRGWGGQLPVGAAVRSGLALGRLSRMGRTAAGRGGSKNGNQKDAFRRLFCLRIICSGRDQRRYRSKCSQVFSFRVRVSLLRGKVAAPTAFNSAVIVARIGTVLSQ